MARGPGEFRWTLLPTLASYYVYRYERDYGRSIKLRKEVQERFGMPLSGSEMKVDRNMKEAYEIAFGQFDGKKGSNHHDRYVVEKFEDMPFEKIKEYYEQIINENISIENKSVLKQHAIKILKSAPRERDMYIATTIEHGLNIRDVIEDISENSAYLKEVVYEDPEDAKYQSEVNESVGRSALTDEELEERSAVISEPILVGSSKRWKRDKSISWTALERAGHKCELDSSHKTFKRVGQEVDFVEPHHLIPISKQEHFQKSLDCVSNIVSLCPNCHRGIHCADKEERRKCISETFELKKQSLHDSGIEISLKSLFDIYKV